MISIIIPSYNQEKYLCDAIDSVLAQKRGKVNRTTKYEVIIVDDGSTDHSLEIARRYEMSTVYRLPVKVISQVNKGLSSARNTGIMAATGEYILPLDADDILLENCLEKIQEVINKTHADVIGLSFKEFGMRNTLITLMSNPTIQDFKVANRIGYCSAIKREALIEVGGYSPKMIWGYEDFHLWFNLLKRGKKIVTIPVMMWLYRTKEHSMINDSMAHHNELVAQINKDFNLDLPEIKTPLPQ